MPGPDIGLRLRVEVALLSTDDGGRKSPIRDGYRPISVVGTGDDELLIGLAQLRLARELAPGDSGVGTLEFSRSVAELAKAKLPPGADFALAEGRKVVGRAQVLKVV
jgi:elongation factor Tu